jgi:hypothetical protein
MSDFRERLMTFLEALRHPRAKPTDIEILDARLDVVDKRLSGLDRRLDGMAEGYRRAAAALHHR